MRIVDSLRPSRWLVGPARAERLLDHRVPDDDPVARLLSDANRGVAGPVRGEQKVTLAFRTATPPLRRSVEAGPVLTVARGDAPRRLVTAPRLLALKVAVVGAATAVVGGLALAGTVDGLTMPSRTPDRPTLSIAAEQGAVAGRGGIIPTSAPPSSSTAATTLAGGAGTQNTVRTGVGVPAGATAGAKPAPKGPVPKGPIPNSPVPNGPGRDVGPGSTTQDCQTWARGPFGPKGQRQAWVKAVNRLRAAAGGWVHVPAYCYPVLHEGAKPNPGPPQFATASQYANKAATSGADG